MSENNSHPYDKILAEFDRQMTVLLVRALANELATELDLHYDQGQLRDLREEDTIQVLVEAVQYLREQEDELPEAVVHVLRLAGEDLNPSA